MQHTSSPSRLKDALQWTLALNTFLFVYGLVLQLETFSPENPYLHPLLLVAFLAVHLPLAYDWWLLSTGRPVSLVGSYLTVVSLRVAPLLVLVPSVLFLFLAPGAVGGLWLLMLFAGALFGSAVVASYGLALFWGLELAFWFLFGPKLVFSSFPSSAFWKRWLHPDLRLRPLLILLFLLFVAVYLFAGLIMSAGFTVWLVPAYSSFWESWSF